MAVKWMHDQQVLSNASHHFTSDATVTLYSLPWPYIPGTDQLLVFWGGRLLIVGPDYEETSGSSITLLRGPTFMYKTGDRIDIYRIPNTLSLGDITVSHSKMELNLLLRDINTVALVVSERKFYIKKLSGWEEFILPYHTTTSGHVFHYYKQVVTSSSDKVITLDRAAIGGKSSILVFVDDRIQSFSDYELTDEVTVTFTNDLVLDPSYTEHTVEVITSDNDPWEMRVDHNSTFGYNSDNDIIEQNIFVEGDLAAHISYTYDERHNVTHQITTKGNKIVTQIFTYDINDNITGYDTTISFV